MAFSTSEDAYGEPRRTVIPSPESMPPDELTRLGLIDDDDIIVDEAAMLMAQLDHVGEDLTPYRAAIVSVAERLRIVGAGMVHAHQQAAALLQVLAGEFGFVGESVTESDPAAADLSRVLERRRGLPVSLCVIYVGAARRVGWHAHVLDVSGHVLAIVGSDANPVVIDPSAAGVRLLGGQFGTLSSAANSGDANAMSYVTAVSNREVLVRLLLHQATCAEQAGKGRRAFELYSRSSILAPAYSRIWLKRARFEFEKDDIISARSSLIAVLETTREPTLRCRVLDMLDEISAS